MVLQYIFLFFGERHICLSAEQRKIFPLLIFYLQHIASKSSYLRKTDGNYFVACSNEQLRNCNTLRFMGNRFKTDDCICFAKMHDNVGVIDISSVFIF